MPLRIIPERCEAMEDDVQSASAEGGHIFNDDPFGLKLADEAEILKPQARAGPREGEPEPLAASSPCETNVLAGEATCDDVDGDAVCIHNFLGQTGVVTVDWDVGPILILGSGWVWLYFAKGRDRTGESRGGKEW